MRRLAWFPSLICALLVTTSALAAPMPWKENFFAAPAHVILDAANQVSLPADEEAIILFEERHQVYGVDGASRRRYRQVYQVRSEAAARRWNALDASWEPWHEDRPEVRARIVAPDGHVFFLDPKTIETNTPRTADRDLYTDRSALRAPLPGVTRGAVVEVEIVSHESKPLFDEGTVEGWVFVSGTAVQESRLVVDAPEALPVNFVLIHGESVKRTATRSEGRLTTTFEGGPWKARDPLFPFSAPEVRRSSFVLFSTGRSWKRVADRYSAVVDAQLKGAGLLDYARQTTAGAKTRDARVAALVERLNREIRYTGVEFGAAALVPHPPGEVLSRRFGDCKDKSTLLVGLLRVLGIEAHVALLDADVGPDIDERIPGMGGFNHAIVYIPGSPALWPALWIDPTDPYVPVGDLPLSDQGRLALVIRPGTTGLVKTPTATAKQNLTQEVRELVLAEDGSMALKERTLYKGALADSVRQRHASLGHEELESGLQKYAIDEYKVKRLAGWSHAKPEDLSTPFTLELTMEGVSTGAANGDSAAIPLPVAPLFRQLPAELRDPEEAASSLPAALKGVKRTTDFVYPMPYSYELVVRIKPAHGFVVQELPADETVTLGPARLTFTCRAQGDGSVEARTLFDSGPSRLTAAALAKFHEDFAAYMKTPTQMVKLVLGAEDLLQAGKSKQALAAFRQLDKEHPQSAHHAAQLARALLLVGLGETARKQALRATTLDPKSSQAYATLGMVLEHDLLGRVMHPGFDGKGAEDAFRRAVELDAENVYAQAQFALLAEYDEEGNHNWPSVRLEVALERHERHQKLKNRDKDYDLNYLITLFRLKRYADVVTKAKTLPASTNSLALAVASVALTKGTAEALRQASILAPSAEDRPEILRAAAAEIMSLRRYPESAALFDEAARGHKNAAEIRLLAATLHQTKRFEKRTLNRRDPKDVVRGLMGLMASESPSTKEDVQPLFAQDTIKSQEDVNSAKKAFVRGALRNRGNSTLSMAEVADIATSREWAQTGDPRWGVWVHPPETEAHQGLFMVPRPDGFRFLAAGRGQSTSPLGQEALRLLDKGDLAGARYLLDQCEDQFKQQRQSDPLDVIPFLAIWQGGDKNDPSVIRLAITLTGEEAKLAPRDDEILQRCRQQTAEPARTGCEVALLFRLERDNRGVECRAVADGLLARYPKSERASHYATDMAIRSQDWDAATRLAKASLQRNPADAKALLQLSEIQINQGHTAECMAQLRKVIETGASQVTAYNNLAWYALATGNTDRAAVDNARQAVRLSQRKDDAYLHTLAAVLADAGQVEEARETLLELLELRADKQPSPIDWFIVGRIAENYDDVEAARSAYRKVGAPVFAAPFSTHALVQQRLRALGAK